jgi:hypothetical protein
MYIYCSDYICERFPKARSENNLLTSNLNQVCVCVQTNILNAEFKLDKIFFIN